MQTHGIWRETFRSCQPVPPAEANFWCTGKYSTGEIPNPIKGAAYFLVQFKFVNQGLVTVVINEKVLTIKITLLRKFL